MDQPFHVRILEYANRYLESLPAVEKANIIGDIHALRTGKLEKVRIKQLQGPIRELIVGNHRITYFKHAATLYFVRGFRKKSNKTPRQEIEYARSIYKKISM